LYYLGRAGDESLGFSAPYHDGAYFSRLNPGKMKTTPDASLSENYFIARGYGHKIKLLLPFCSNPYLSGSESQSGKQASTLGFSSKYGDVFFEVSPFISSARGTKTKRVVSRRIVEEDHIGKDQLYTFLLETDVIIKAKLRGRRILKKEFGEFADWVVFLFDYMKKHMDWERYLEGETHRTIVDVDRKLDKLLDEQPL
jgi:hypothetical protein